MKKTILSLLLIVFSFIVVHDYVIAEVDNDTQSELILLSSGQIDSSSMCDISQIHHHLHEILIGADLFDHLILNDTHSKTYTGSFLQQFTLSKISNSLYRPPIVQLLFHLLFFD